MQAIVGVCGGYPAGGVDVMNVFVAGGIDRLNYFQYRCGLRTFKGSQRENDGMWIFCTYFIYERDVSCLKRRIADVFTTIIRTQIYDYDIRLVAREIPVWRTGEVNRLHFEVLAVHTNASRCTQRAIGEADGALSDL